MISLKCSARVREVQQLIERSQIAPSGLKGRNSLTRGLPKRGVVLNASGTPPPCFSGWLERGVNLKSVSRHVALKMFSNCNACLILWNYKSKLINCDVVIAIFREV